MYALPSRAITSTLWWPRIYFQRSSTPRHFLLLKLGWVLRTREALWYTDLNRREVFNIRIFFFVIVVTATGVCEIVFRLTNGQGVFQWIRGKARTLYDKNNKPEAITADNVLLKWVEQFSFLFWFWFKVMYRALTRHPSSSLFAQCGSVTRVGMGLAWECDSRGNMMRLCVRRERERFFQDGGRLKNGKQTFSLC